MLITTPGNKIIEVVNTITGKEKILYNGNLVAAQRTVAGGIHLFTVTENNETVNYEVEIMLRWHGLGYYVNVRRNGLMIFSNK
ncbi:MAG: hypothetical protein ACRC3B_20680 [Bacteroidia bacterium]